MKILKFWWGLHYNLLIAFGGVDILTILILLIPKHGLFFHLCLPWFLLSVFYSFQCIEISCPWLNLLLSSLFFFDVTLSGIAFKFLFLVACHCRFYNCFLFLYVDFVSRNFTIFVYSNSFLVKSLRFSLYNTLSMDNFTSSFSVWLLLLIIFFLASSG